MHKYLSNIRRALCIIAISLFTVVPVLTSAYSNYHSHTLLADCPADDPECDPSNPFGNTGNTGSTNVGNNTGSTNTGNNTGSTNTGNNTGSTNTGNNTGSTNVGSNTSGLSNLGQKLVNPLALTHINNLCDFVNAILNIVAEIGGVVAVLFIIWSGFLFIKAQGNEGEIKKAKSTFFTTIIGTAILLGASIITKLIVNTVGAVTGQGGGGICSS